jgi:hypothetical protein
MPWSQPQQVPASQGGPIQRGGQQQSPANPGRGSDWGSWNNPYQPSPTGNSGMGGLTNPGAGAGMIGGMSPFGGQMASSMAGPRVAQEGPGMVPGGQMLPTNPAPPGARTAGIPGLPTAGGGSDPNSPLGRIESYFGQLGTPVSPLQQQSLGGISQFLSSNPYAQSNNALQGILGGSGFNEANQAYRDVGDANYFGKAQNAFGGAQDFFKNLGGQNLFGGAEQAARGLQQGNFFDGAEGVFNRLENFNPFTSAQGALEGQLGANPGQGMLDALRPQFERNLAAANQQGGRFGSANAILRSRAVDDYNLLGAQALQRGVDQQQNAANILGMIGNSLIGARGAAGQGLLGVGQGRVGQQTNAMQGLLGAGQGRLSQGLGVGQGMLGAGQGMLGVGQGQLSQGLGAAQGLSGNAQSLMQGQLGAAQGLSQNQNNLFNALSGSYGIGSQHAGQLAQRQQQAMQILSGLLGTSFGATFGAPTVIPPTGGQTGAQIGGAIGSALPVLLGGGQQQPMIPGNNVWGPASQYGF